MARITQLDPSTTTGKSGELLSAVKANMGLIPNMTRAMAQSSAVLGGYLGLAGALSGGTLNPQIRELIALAVAEANGCDYCLAAHTLIGGMHKISPEDLLSARRGESGDPKTEAALTFALDVLANKGHVSDVSIEVVRAAGFSEGEIGEIVAHVALNVFTNYFNSAVQTDLDFPAAPALN